MKYVIIGAMQVEIDNLNERLGTEKTDEFAGHEIYSAKHGGNEIYITQSGVGKVNSACTTQAMIDRYHPDFVINTGIAGGIAAELKQGDIVIGTYLRYHDFNPIEILETVRPKTYEFYADKTLCALAGEACAELGVKFMFAPIATGDCFVSDSATVSRIREQTNAACVEMEGAAIAHACIINNTPFAIIRAISDFADENAENSYAQFEKKAADIAGYIVEKIVKGQ